MAIRTVSNAGGEWSSAATWVGGVKPIVGRDSVAFTATSGNLLVDADITIDTTIKGIDFRNYVNTLTLKGTSIHIDDTSTSGRASFINFGTGGYTVVAREYLSNNIINPADNNSLGIVIVPTLSQVVTITSNGTAWNQYIQFGTQNSQVISLADNCTINGRWDMIFSGTIFQNNRLILNGNPNFDLSVSGSEYASIQNFYQCTSVIEINSPQLYSRGFAFDGNRLEINSPIFDFSLFIGSIQFSNSLGTPTVVVITSPHVISDISNSSSNLTLTANNLIGTLINMDGSGVYSFTNINGNIESNISGVPGYTFTLNVSGTINGDISTSNSLTSITANTINTVSVGCQLGSIGNLTFNVPNLTAASLSLQTNGILTIGPFTTFNVTNSLYLRTDLPDGSITQTFSNLNLTTSVYIQAATSNITFAGLTTPTLTVISTTSSTLDLGSTAGSITTFSMTSPVATINKNNCAITTATITSTTSATITGTNNVLNTLTTTAPLLVLDAANVMNSTTNINLTTNTTRTIQLTSAMNVNSIICVNTNLTSLTFTGNFDATIGIIDRIIALNLVANRQYTITQNAFLYNCTIASTTPGTRAKFDMIVPIENLLGVSAIDIDSSLTPRGVHTYFGTVTNCLNWRNFTDCKIPQLCSTF